MSDQFLIFAGHEYYPSGGWKDFDGSFSSLEVARAAIGELDYYEWVQIVDQEKSAIVYSAYRDGSGVVHED